MALSNLSLLDLTTTNTTASTITSGTVSPTANALVICGSAYRGGTQRTAQTPSTTATGMVIILVVLKQVQVLGIHRLLQVLVLEHLLLHGAVLQTSK